LRNLKEFIISNINNMTSTETVLYESDAISRKGLENVYGSPKNIEIFLDKYKNVTYKNKSITLYPEKRIVMKKLENIIVFGGEPVIQELTEEQLKGFKEYVPLAAVLVQKWGYGFYHFINEMLPKIIRIYEYNPKMPILIFYNETFIKQTLEYLKITNPIIVYNNGTMIFPIKKAIHITETASGNPTLSDIEIIRKHINKRVPRVDKPAINIFIYRKEQLRSIVNFNEIFEALKVEFPEEEWIIFNSLAFSEAVELFSRAKLIIGAHGAGLSNMIFAPKGIPIIELFPNDMVNLCYWHLSWTLENRHSCFICDSTGPPFLNININIEELTKHIRETII